MNEAILTIHVENYRSCTLDSMAAIDLSPTNIKAHYRLASALFALNKLPEAHSACSAGLELDPSNKSLLMLAEKIKEKRAAQAAAERKKQEKEDRLKKEAATLIAALKFRQIRTRKTDKPPEMEDAVIRLVPDPLSATTSTLIFPVVILYPLHLQSDFVKAFGEEQTLQGHLDYLLPLPWDGGKEYTPKEVEAYLETAEGGLIKWGKRVELLKVLSGGKVEVVDGLVRVNLVPRRRASEWIEAIKKRKGAS